MNGTFQLIRRARREGISLKLPQTFEASGSTACVREAPEIPAQSPGNEEPLHTGSIYRELMKKYDRVNTRHLNSQ
jgi:hypothetical protein